MYQDMQFGEKNIIRHFGSQSVFERQPRKHAINPPVNLSKHNDFDTMQNPPLHVYVLFFQMKLDEPRFSSRSCSGREPSGISGACFCGPDVLPSSQPTNQQREASKKTYDKTTKNTAAHGN